LPSVSIQSNQNVLLNLDLASLGERILAYIIDAVVIFVYFFAVKTIFGFDFSVKMFNGHNVYSHVTELILFSVPLWFYDLAWESLNRGRSLGKMVMKLQVINENGEPATFNDYFMRWLFRPIDFYGGLILVSLVGSLFDGEGTQKLIGILTVLACVPGIVSIISVSYSPLHQRIGDRLAGTVVLRKSKSVSLKDTILLKTKKNYKVVYKNALQLSDRDVRLIKETLEYYYNTREKSYVKKLSKKAQDFLKVSKGKYTDLQFLQVLMKDYNHLAIEQSDKL